MNRQHLTALAILPKISSTLSILGSAAIISECLYFDRSLIKRVMNRILCVMAIFDILESVWNFASTWAMSGNPHGDNELDVLYTIGNDYTCTIQGFFLQLGVTIPILNACLSIYYLLVIKFSWTEEDIREKAERWFYGVSIALGLITSIAAIPLDLYHPCEVWCWIGESESDGGNKYQLFRLLFYFGPLMICFLVIASNMIIVVWTVLSLETISSRYVTQSYTNRAFGPNKISKVKALATKYILKKDEARKASRREVSHDIPNEEDVNGQIDSLNPSHNVRIKELMRKLESVKEKSSRSGSGQTSNSEIGRILELKKIAHKSGNSQATDSSRILALRRDKKNKSSNKDTNESLIASSQRGPNTSAVEKSSAEQHRDIKKSPEEMRDLKVSSLTKFSQRSSNGVVFTNSSCKDVEEIPAKRFFGSFERSPKEVRKLQVTSLIDIPGRSPNTAMLTDSNCKKLDKTPAEPYLRMYSQPHRNSNLPSSLRKPKNRLKRHYTADDAPDEITLSRRALKRDNSKIRFNVIDNVESFLPGLSIKSKAVKSEAVKSEAEGAFTGVVDNVESFLPGLSIKSEAESVFSGVVKSGGFGSLTVKQDSLLASARCSQCSQCSQNLAPMVGPCSGQNSTSVKCSESVGIPADPNSTSNACSCCDELQPKNKRQRFKSKSRLVTEQALFYVVSFLLTFTWSIVNRLILLNRKDGVYLLLLGNAFFDPLQGFVNYLVYIRPKFRSSRKKYPQKNGFVIIYHLITHKEMMNDKNQENEELMRSELSQWRSIRDSASKNSQLLRLESVASDDGVVEIVTLDPTSGRTEDTLQSDDDRLSQTMAITEGCV